MNLFTMKRGGGLMFLLMVIALIISIGACQTGVDGVPDDANGVDYGNHTSDYAFLVSNNTNRDLVAFWGSLNSGYLLGGIPSGAKNHGIWKNPAIFKNSTDNAMILLTKQQYAENKDDLIALQYSPFTRVYVFYNHAVAEGNANTIYQISDRIGGNYKLTIQNPTNYNVELRLGGVNGETIGYAANGMLTTTLYVSEGDFNIFPVFKKYNSIRDTVETLYPKLATGYAWFMPLGFEDTPTGREQTFNIQLATQGLGSATSGVAWLAINNQTNPPIAIHMVQGLNVIRTTAGVSYFTGQKTFQVDMPRTTVGSNTTFASETQIAGYKLGPDGFEVDIEDSEGGKNHTLAVDMMYTVTVTGSHLNNPIDLKATLTGTPTNVSDF